MINWIQNKRAPQPADVEISLINKGNSVHFAFTEGVVSTKFRHSDRVIVGIDDEMMRVYFEGHPEGYKLVKKGNGYHTYISAKTLKNIIHPAEICGSFVIKKDADGCYYIPIGALPR